MNVTRLLKSELWKRYGSKEHPAEWDGNVFGHVVFGLSQATVDTTIGGGRVLMEHRRLKLDLDEARVNARARELAKALWQRL